MAVVPNQMPLILQNLKKRGGMYVYPVTFEALVSYIAGYNHGVVNSGGESVLDAFQEWLERRIGHSCSLSWPALVRDVFAKKIQEKAIPTLFELFEEFFAEKKQKKLQRYRRHAPVSSK